MIPSRHPKARGPVNTYSHWWTVRTRHITLVATSRTMRVKPRLPLCPGSVLNMGPLRWVLTTEENSLFWQDDLAVDGLPQ